MNLGMPDNGNAALAIRRWANAQEQVCVQKFVPDPPEYVEYDFRENCKEEAYDSMIVFYGISIDPPIEFEYGEAL